MSPDFKKDESDSHAIRADRNGRPALIRGGLHKSANFPQISQFPNLAPIKPGLGLILGKGIFLCRILLFDPLLYDIIG